MSKTRYKSALLTTLPNGRVKVEINKGAFRERRRFPSAEKARDFVDRVELAADGEDYISPADELDLRRARAILPPDVSVLDAAKYFVEMHREVETPMTLPEASEQYINDCTARGLRKRTIENSRMRVYKFTDANPHWGCHEIGTDDVRVWLHGLGGISAESKNNYRRALHAFFAWCQERGYCRSNPVTDVRPWKSEQDDPAVFTVETVEQWLTHVAAERPEMVPYYAVGFFAGVRSSELAELRGEDIRDGAIHIGARIAKMRARRVIDMQPNLCAWLAAYPPAEQLRCCPDISWRRRQKEMLTAAGLEWVPNGMRHSFATYLLARDRSADRVAHDLGHPNTTLLLTTYRGLATTEDGAAYFGIVPE